MNRDDAKIQVQQATDIVRLIGEQVALRPRGKEFIGVCPFHDDKNPSMYVSPAKQIYKCFACGAGGDVFAFVVNYHKMTFPEALKHLAERAGITLPAWNPRGGPGSEGGEERQGPTERQLISQANQKALAFYHALLKHSEHGRLPREYVEKRRISAEMVAAFGLGYAPDRWDGLATMIREKKWDARPFELAGLISRRDRNQNAGATTDASLDAQGLSLKSQASENSQPRERLGFGSDTQGFGSVSPDFRSDSQDSRLKTQDFSSSVPTSSPPTAAVTSSTAAGHYDRLRHRLIFPICDALGRPIAFGGRKLRAEDEPKYLNSPETPLFNKSATLYGLHLAKKAIIDSRVAVIVEGYTDVIACHQAGVKNVVATLGTALTAQHVGELRRYCDKVVLIYDADVAGIKAADRAVEVFLNEQLDVAIAVLPDELDPADLLEREDGLEQWHKAVAEATEALEYQFARISEQMTASDTLTGRQKIIEEYLRKLGQLGLARNTHDGGGIRGGVNSMVVRQAMILQRLSQLLHLPEKEITATMKRLTPPPRQMFVPRDPPTASSAAPPNLPNSPDSEEFAPRNEDFAQNNEETLVLTLGANRIKALRVAETQLMGCLLRAPELFHLALSDGSTLDEAITPAELVNPASRQLFAVIYDQLLESGQPTLGTTLANLAERERGDLAALATQAEEVAERASMNDPQRLEAMLRGAAETLLRHHREQRYRQRPLADNEDPAQMEQALRRAVEHNRAPSPKRFPSLR